MYAVFYRLGGYEETWRTTGDWYGNDKEAGIGASEAQRILRHIGYPFAQAEVREVEAPVVTETAVTHYICPLCRKPLRSDEQWQVIAGDPITAGGVAHQNCFATPAVEGGHGETLPAYWNASASMASSVPSKMVLTTPAKCEFCTSTVLVRAYDMGEGRNMLLCVDCRENIKRGKEIMG